MNTEKLDIAKLGKIHARTAPGRELLPEAWVKLMSDIYSFSTSCNGLILLSGPAGSGKTTFIKILQDRKPADLDIVPVTHASISPKSDWIIDAITPWLTSSKQKNQPITEKMRALSDITDCP